MSLKHKPQPSELDHIRDTLTDVVDVLGQTRSEMHQRFDQQDRRFDQHDERFHQQDRKISAFRQETLERFDQLELLIRQLLPNANH